MFEIDTSSEFGQRVLRRMEEDLVIWLTTVSDDGAPHPRPVWFTWDGESFHIYSQPNTHKIPHIESNSDVALNLNTDTAGSDVVVFLGRAQIRRDMPWADTDAPYVEKYREEMQGLGMTPEQFAESYSVPIRVTPTRLRGH